MPGRRSFYSQATALEAQTTTSRRDAVASLLAPAILTVAGCVSQPVCAAEAEEVAAADVLPLVPPPPPPPPLLAFKDPVGLFELGLPKGWFKVRPTVAGDLPNEEGKGRRGSRIFSAGEVSDPYAAKILSVERYPAKALLLELGLPPADAQAKGNDATSWRSLGQTSETLAQTLVNRRDAETQTQGMTSMTTRVVKGSTAVSEDGATFRFAAELDVPVMRPDLLEEQTGRSGIKRISFYRGELRTGETMKVTDTEVPRAIITALWTSVESSDYSSDAKFKATIDAVLDSFVVL